jgi:hypothetical protein
MLETILELLNNRAVLIVIGVLVGGLVTGVTNFFLQRSQDRRRFEHERVMQQRREQESTARREQWQKEEKAQKDRWAREDEAQERRWNREDWLRNYDERRDAYTALIAATDEALIARAAAFRDQNRLVESIEGARLGAAKIRTIAPSHVWYVAHKLVDAYSEYAAATFEQKAKAEEKAEVLRERHYQFVQLAQTDLGLEDRASEASQRVYKEIVNELGAELPK